MGIGSTHLRSMLEGSIYQLYSHPIYCVAGLGIL
jgi:hypothetical protein